MQTIIISETIQEFNGIRYYLQGRYFRKKNGNILHRTVWKFHNGNIPNGFHIHHKDFDRSNNNIENLEAMSQSQHSKLHINLREDNSAFFNASSKARIKAAEWHKSDEGKEWHKRQYQSNCKDKILARKIKNCLQCKNEFEGFPFQKFCSNVCKSKYRRSNKLDHETRICSICGKEFETIKYGKTKTCSRDCGAKLSGENRKKNKIN
ncbi:MAG: HNH endonuclease signature motif containing protein [Candidatus Thorarchaeota archaeon]